MITIEQKLSRAIASRRNYKFLLKVLSYEIKKCDEKAIQDYLDKMIKTTKINVHKLDREIPELRSLISALKGKV